MLPLLTIIPVLCHDMSRREVGHDGTTPVNRSLKIQAFFQGTIGQSSNHFEWRRLAYLITRGN